jgi:hypothetical protein
VLENQRNMHYLVLKLLQNINNSNSNQKEIDEFFLRFLPVSRYNESPVAESGRNLRSRQIFDINSLPLVVDSTTKSCSSPLGK